MWKTLYIICVPLALVLSYLLNKSILWALFHAAFSFSYMLYLGFFRNGDVELAIRALAG